MAPRLSILICTINGRECEFNSLIKLLNSQINGRFDDKIEILSLRDNREMIVGVKRNKLIQMAAGDYVVFCDDDDSVANNYVETILSNLNNNPDCIGLKGIITTNGTNPKTFIHSIKYNNYFERNGIYYRPPNHLNPIRRSIAVNYLFPEKNCGEDTDWAMKICRDGILKNEVFIDEIMYYYLYNQHKTATQNLNK